MSVEWTAPVERCPICKTSIGELHNCGTFPCSIERCPSCGCQLLGCDCGGGKDGYINLPDADRVPWTGAWPGIAECVEFGWWAKLIKGKGWVSCGKDEPGAQPDLNRLYRRKEAMWSRSLKKFVLQTLPKS